MGQLSFADVDRARLTCRCGTPRSSSSTSRRPVAARPATGTTSTPSPRSVPSRCAAERCSASWPRWSTRAAAFRRRSSRSPASPRPWCATRRRSTPCCPHFSNSPAAQCSSPTTPVSTSASFAPPQSAARSPGRARRCCAPSGWPGGCSPATRPPACGSPRWPGCSAQAPRRHTGRSTTRGPPSTCCTRSSSGSATRACTPTPTCASYLPDVSPEQRRKRVLAAALPHRPGVYLFRGPADEVLYVGTAVDLRRRAGQYFNGTDPRPRIKEMVALATAVDHVECAHDLEAGVRELRLLAAHAPPYNRRSKFPRRWWWIVLTDEAFPRFSIVRHPEGRQRRRPVPVARRRRRDGRPAGPVHRAAHLHHADRALGASRPRLPRTRTLTVPGTARRRRRRVRRGAAARGGADRRRRGRRAVGGAGPHRRAGRTATATRPPPGCATTPRPRSTCCGAVSGCARWPSVTELVAARPDGDGGWHLAVIRCGQLAAAGVARRGVPPMPVVDAISAAAQAILPVPAPLGGALVEEVALIMRWLAQPGVRIVRAEPGWASPVGSAGRWASWAASARSARLAAAADARRFRPAG